MILLIKSSSRLRSQSLALYNIARKTKEHSENIQDIPKKKDPEKIQKKIQKRFKEIFKQYS